MTDSLNEHGLDKTFELYRYSNNKFNRARVELGIFYYRTGRYSEAELNLVFPLISAATTGFDYIYDRTADYQYSDFENHISNMLSYGILQDYLQENRFYESVYYLAASLYAEGDTLNSSYLWRIVSEFSDDDGGWKRRSELQLISPFIEPIIGQRP